jgi:transcriptional regulator with XRE-family HTH domain
VTDEEEEKRIRMEFAQAFRAARERAGLTQRDVAHQLGVSQPYVNHIERGYRNITLATMAAFAHVVGCVCSVSLVPVTKSDPDAK